jgi:hypothetical protein
MKKLYIEAYACSEYGAGPDYLVLEVTQAVVDYIKELQTVCLMHKLNEVHTSRVGTYEWGPGDVADDLRLQLDSLVVTQTSFWFTAVPKHSDYHVETRGQLIGDLVKGFERSAGEPWVMGSNLSVLTGLYTAEEG